MVRQNPLVAGGRISNIQPMTDYRDIRPLTFDERAQRAAQRQAEQELAHQRILDQLDNWEFGSEKGGRQPIVLPQEVALRVVADVEAGHADRAIERKYASTPWKFSARWLRRAINNGSLYRMAGMRQLARQNPAQNGPVLAAI